MEHLVKHEYQIKGGKEKAVLEKNPILKYREPIAVFCENGTTKFKVGDGVTPYCDLPLIGKEPVQPDLSQNDNTQPDYVKNRTHYVSKLDDIKWDNIIDERQHFSISFSDNKKITYVKLCECTSLENFMESTVELTTESYKDSELICTTEDSFKIETLESFTNVAESGMYNLVLTDFGDTPLLYIVYDSEKFIQSMSSEFGINTSESLSVGVYCFSAVEENSDYSEQCYISSIQFAELIHKLDEKYLPEYATVAKTGNYNDLNDIPTLVGQKTSDGGEIFNDYDNNKALSKYSKASGENNIAGVKVFYITAWNRNAKTYTLDSVEGLEVGDIVSIKWGGSYINFGKITAIYTENLTITTDKFAINDVGDPNTTLGVLFVVDKPTIGLHSFDDGQHVEGTNNVALLWGAHAEGYGNVSADRYAHTEGIGNIAYYAAHAEGYKTAATGKGSHAEGYNTKATSFYSHAEGNTTEATGNQSHAEGYGTHATGEQSHAEGINTNATSLAAHAEGYGTKAKGNGAHAEGGSTTASGVCSHAEGYNTTIGKAIKDANGKITYSGGNYSHAEGNSTTASGEASHAEGSGTIAEGDCSHAEGGGTEAKGTFAHAEGFDTHAWGEASHTEGYATYATNTYSHAEGNITHADGVASHAEGYNTYATGAYSHAEGNTTKAKNTYAHAEGFDTDATGLAAHAEGSKTEASKTCSHAEGHITHATGNYAHAEGHDTHASGDSSHTEGYDTKAEGNYSHAEGRGTHAKGNYSHAGGRYTFAEYNDQTVIGKFNNNKKDTLLEVGCGANEGQRENCFEAGKNQNGKFIRIGNTQITEDQLRELKQYKLTAGDGINIDDNNVISATGGGGTGGGTTDYEELDNKPKINGVELSGDISLGELGIDIPNMDNYYTKTEIDTLIGDIETALDELHNYAQALINGGAE